MRALTTETEPKATARHAGLVSIGILASRLIGLIRQRAVGHYLGTGDSADALAAAFRVGNVIQNLLGEGTLSATIVPIYVRTRLESATLAARFARAALGWLLLAVLSLAALGVLFAPTLAALQAPAFEGEKRALMVELIRILFPMTSVLVISAWSLGILSAHRRFLLPYAAPVLWSLAQIAAVVIAARGLGLSERGLATSIAWGAAAGAVLQVLVMIPTARKLLGSLTPTLDLRVAGVREAAMRFPTALVGRGVIQLSGLIDTYLVSLLGTGAVASFVYAQTVYLLPMALLGTGEAAVALPDFAERNIDAPGVKLELQQRLGASLTRVLVLSVGAAVCFAVMSEEVITLLLRGGLFDQHSTREVAAILLVYALGLPANAVSRLFSTTCFALGDTGRPAVFATLRVLASTGISLIAMRHFGVQGVVLGAVFAGWLELVLLAMRVRAALGGTGFGAVPFARVVGLGCATALAGFGLQRLLAPLSLNTFLASALILGFAGACFLLASRLLGLLSFRAMRLRR